jgi:hypothetical protein
MQKKLLKSYFILTFESISIFKFLTLNSNALPNNKSFSDQRINCFNFRKLFFNSLIFIFELLAYFGLLLNLIFKYFLLLN